MGCGNYLASEPQQESEAKGRSRTQDLYAGGVDGVSVRLQVSAAATNGWLCAGLDIKTAFLGAPLYQDQKGRAVLTPGDLSSGSLDFETLVKKLQSVQGDRVKIVVVSPPKILVRLGLVEESEKWLVVKALYGLAEAPRRWSAHRDLLLRQLAWEDNGRRYSLDACVADNNLWRIVSKAKPETTEAHQTSTDGAQTITPSEPGRSTQQSPQDNQGVRLHGLLGVYVDDMLITAENEVQTKLLQELRQLWSTSDPEIADVGRPLRFCGFNLHRLTGGGYLLNQEDYVQDLLQKFPDVQGTAEVPCLKEEDPEPENPDPVQLRRAQALAGALQWLTTRTRPDICFAVNQTAQLMSKFPAYATKYAQNILRYLRGTQSLGLRFGPLSGPSDYGPSGELVAPRTAGLVEIYGDASFAPSSAKSQTGLVATLSGHVIAWASHRQSVTSQSSAEAELYATGDGVLLLQTLEPLIQELHASPIRKLVYNDNVGCISLYSAPNGAWRTRHLRLKARGGRELLESGYFEIRHLAGKWMLADLATKALAFPRHRELLHLLEMSEPSGCEKTKEIRMLHGESSGFPQSRGSVGSKRAMGIRTVVLALSILALAASKITITVEDSEDGGRVMDMLLVLGASLLVMAAYALRRWCASGANNDPVEVSGSGKDEDEWSVVEQDTEESSPGFTSSGPQVVMESRTLASTLTQRRTRKSPAEDHPGVSQAVDEQPGLRKVSGFGFQNSSFSGLGKGDAPHHSDSSSGLGKEDALRNSDSSAGLGQRMASPSTVITQTGVRQVVEDEIQEEEIRIHPYWRPPQVPPRMIWPELPAWGGPPSLFHQPTPTFVSKDEWVVNKERGVLTRFHGSARLYLFDPHKAKLPLGIGMARDGSADRPASFLSQV